MPLDDTMGSLSVPRGEETESFGTPFEHNDERWNAIGDGQLPEDGEEMLLCYDEHTNDMWVAGFDDLGHKHIWTAHPYSSTERVPTHWRRTTVPEGAEGQRQTSAAKAYRERQKRLSKA